MFLKVTTMQKVVVVGVIIIITTTTEKMNTGKPETHNQTLHDNDPCTRNTQIQTLTQEEKTNIDTIRRIMSEKKTTLPSLRNQDQRTVKSETKRVNDLMTNIPINDITEFYDLIYTGPILVCGKKEKKKRKKKKKKIGVPLKTTDRKSKPSGNWDLNHR